MLEIPFKIESASDDYTLELLLCKLVKQTRGFCNVHCHPFFQILSSIGKCNRAKNKNGIITKLVEKIVD